MENSVCEISWNLVENWLRNPRNSIILVDEFNVNLTIVVLLHGEMHNRRVPPSLKMGTHSTRLCSTQTGTVGTHLDNDFVCTSSAVGAVPVWLFLRWIPDRLVRTRVGEFVWYPSAVMVCVMCRPGRIHAFIYLMCFGGFNLMMATVFLF